MKNFLLIFLLLLLPVSVLAQAIESRPSKLPPKGAIFSPKPVQLYENADGVLCEKSYRNKYVKDGYGYKTVADTFLDPRKYRDTILADGTHSRLYGVPECLVGVPAWKYFCLPDGVCMFMDCNQTFLYPTNLKPGIYNFAKDWVDILSIKDGVPTVEELIWYTYGPEKPTSSTSSSSYSTSTSGFSDNKPADCILRGKNMNAKVKIVPTYNRADFKIRTVSYGEDLTVRFVSRSRTWGLCGQWEVVEFGEDFSVTFVNSGEDFTIRIVD